MKIEEAMNKAVVIEQNLSLKQASKVMASKNIESLVVMKGKNIIGIITEGDVSSNSGSLGNAVSSVMSKTVITIDKDESLDNAAILMKKNKIKSLPVLEKEKLVGIITADDLLANSNELNEEFLFD